MIALLASSALSLVMRPAVDDVDLPSPQSLALDVPDFTLPGQTGYGADANFTDMQSRLEQNLQTMEQKPDSSG